MYAVKPWGHVALIGSSVGSYAMGIGMRWRESNVTIVEKRKSPTYERDTHRRCVLTEQSVKLLTDLGCTEQKLRSVLRPANAWRFSTPQLEVLRESQHFPGCALGESTYHCAEGALLRVLRTEFMRFGGAMQWDTVAYDAYDSNDGTGTWCLRKDYGLGSNTEAILTTADGTRLEDILFVEDPERVAIAFDVSTGTATLDSASLLRIFGATSDVAIVVGARTALHCWRLDGSRCAWRLVQKATKNTEGLVLPAALHDTLKDMMMASEDRSACPWVLPATTPAIRDEASHAKVSILGDGLLPVDAFEWRGDNARTMIEEASTVCRAFYSKKYHRGDVATLLREVEQDSLSRRANLLRRDIKDAEHFLEVHAELESGGAGDQEGEFAPRVSAE